MDDEVPAEVLKQERSGTCTKWTKSYLNPSLVVFTMVVLGGLSCGVCAYYCMPCAVIKQASGGDLITASNATSLQSPIPVPAPNIFNMCNITFSVRDSSHFQCTILEGVLDFLWTIEEINKSLPPFSEGGVIMLCNNLQSIIQQLEEDVQEAVKRVKKLQESLEPKQRRRPPPR